MALCAVNIGCRDAEICDLRWNWEVKVPLEAANSVCERSGNKPELLVLTTGVDTPMLTNTIEFTILCSGLFFDSLVLREHWSGNQHCE